MKKSLFALAVAASFSASAVEVNPNGTGQVLLYPFYTVKNDITTSVHITNTTGQAKAVKVRFSEGKNTWEVLDFNLYLSPYDVWTGTIVDDGNGGAKLITKDTSCTVPTIPSDGVSFRNVLYSSSDFTGNGEIESDTSFNRLQEGHLEVIEMGVVLNTSTFPAADYIEHTDGVPGDCAALTDAWANTEWASDRNTNMSAPTGGISGVGYLINVNQGYQIAYDAVAVDNFWNLSGLGNSAHNRPGTSFPDLNGQVEDGSSIVKLGNLTSNVVANGGLVTSTWTETVDALSAVLMANTITNDYNVYAGTAAETDWVISFPTKHFYVNGTESRNGLGPNRAPFTSSFAADDDLGACETVGLIYFDREERTTTTSTGSVDFSPSQPAATGPELCWETSRITFNDTNLFGSGDTLNNIAVDYSTGWSVSHLTKQW